VIDSRKLEAFATAARAQLIKEVGAQLTAVLSPASTARVETPGAVKELEEAIAKHGGGAAGRQRVAEEQAYVWFNRIVALRFMDANQYTATPVVSPEGGRSAGQPASLAAAKRGEFDPEVFTNPKTIQRITGLLNNTITSHDPQGEAYGLILGAYCAFWHRAMPFMFAPEGNYTALLMPGNLLAEGSVLSKAVATLAAEDCQDVEVIGWLYQYYIAERKQEVFDSFAKGKKAGADEIPAATQLFTPDYIVRYLVQNSVGRLWMLNHPDSKLIDQMEYYIEPVGDPGEFLKIDRPEDLTVMDPACGSGHMLTYAFDLLYAIYEEEGYAPSEIPGLILTNNLYGCEIDERAGALAAFALAMKARAKQRRFFSKLVQPQICVIEPVSFDAAELDQLITRGGDKDAEAPFWNAFARADTRGSLIQLTHDAVEAASSALAANALGAAQLPMTLVSATVHARAEQVLRQAEYLLRQYAVVVTNPPYMGSGKMNSQLSGWLAEHYAEGQADLYAAFMLHDAELCEPGGMVAMITRDAWMTLRAFSDLRRVVLQSQSIESMAHFGPRAFDAISGEVVSTTAFVLCNRPNPETEGVFLRLVDGDSESGKRFLLTNALAHRTVETGWYRASAADLRNVPGEPFVYWLSPAMREVYALGKRLAEVVEPREGINTGDNDRFLRFWWEVSRVRSAIGVDLSASPSRKWVPVKKGGGFRKWYGNRDFVLDWENGGHAIKRFDRAVVRNPGYFFRPSLSWSLVSGGAFGMRAYQAGFATESTGPSAFGDPERLTEVLAVLNSSVTAPLLEATSASLKYRLTALGNLPFAEPADAEGFTRPVHKLVATSKIDWDDFETSWDFTSNPLIEAGGGGAAPTGPPTLEQRIEQHRLFWEELSNRQQALEEANNRAVAELYGLEDEVPCEVPLERVSLTRNAAFRWPRQSEGERTASYTGEAVRELVSYAVGCMFGRYSLDEPGLILASPGERLRDYLAKVPNPSFAPDADGVIPVTGGEWFEDDIVARFRKFLRVSFGEEHFEENLRYVEATLGKPLRQYFLKGFYKEHCSRYSNRPIYWMFSSRPDGKGAFNALIYLHRYTPATPNLVLNEYLREFQAKLRAEIATLERSGTSADAKQADTLRKVLTECEDYERDVLYPLASRNLEMDLDDGVLVNYLRFGRAVQRIKSIEAKRSDVEEWIWPVNPLTREDA
jgi:hypothetical protein